MIPAETIEKIRDKTDIVSVVSEYVKLRKTGKNYVGLCPFHSEKTPSFTVSQEKQLFHCFGCGEGGNVFSFLMKIENLSFVEAVKELGAKAGIKVEESYASSTSRTKKEKLYEVLALAAKYFRDCLEEEKGIKARSYLTQRGISEQTAKIFNLGFAPEGWDNLFRYLISRGAAPELIEQAGLTLPRQDKNDSYYDRFRSRLMFPIYDLRGRVIAFSGRTLTQEEPKYLNSPETPLYHKGETIYGINLAKEEIKKANFVILVEGNLDLLNLYQAGFRNTAAPLGTALTPYQCKLLARFTENIMLAFDADTAGGAAMERSAELLQAEGLKVKIVELEGVKDPDELVRKAGAKGFQEALSKALPFLSFKIKRALAKHNLSEIEARAKALKEVAGILSLEKDTFIQKEYTKMVSQQLSIEEETLLSEIKRQRFYRRELEKDLRRIVEKPPSKLAEAEKNLIALALQDPQALAEIKEKLTVEDFSFPETKMVAQFLFAVDLGNTKDPIHFVLENLPEESAKKMLTKILVAELPAHKDKVLADCLQVIKKERLGKQINLLKTELKRAEKAGETQKVVELLHLLREQATSL